MTGGPVHSLNSIFSNQFKRITRVKSRVFVLKVAMSGLIKTFYERNAITTAVFAIWYSARPLAQIVELFLVFTYIWQEDVAKIPYVPGALCNVNPDRE